MSYDPILKPGDRIVGKWNRTVYVAESLLGAGANGQVYLVRDADGRRAAMKVGYDSLDFQSEINGLSELQQHTRSSGVSPHRSASDEGWSSVDGFIFEVDDLWSADRRVTYPFYVMRYIEGIHPAKFLRENGDDWFAVIGYRILSRLAELHAHGYGFGDLKSDNILVSGYGTTELIDYGGLTSFGKSVRQLSERYDRGYWRAGSRVADAEYDLFAFAVLCLELADHGHDKLAAIEARPQRSVEQLIDLTKELPLCRKVAPVIEACLQGRMMSATLAQQLWRRCVYTAEEQRRRDARSLHKRTSSTSTMTLSLAVALIFSAAIFGTVLYWTMSPAGLLP